jgi:hypothetical protein
MKNKLTVILLLLSQSIIASSKKTTQEDLQKAIAVFQQFKFEYKCKNPERISLFSSEDMRSKHKSFRSNIEVNYNMYMEQTQVNSENIQILEQFKKPIHGEQIILEDQGFGNKNK